MPLVFLSHSSRDKEFVRKLAEDIRSCGHQIWLDEWEIKVGECIVARVGDAISSADYVVLVLSPHAVESGWVDREWKSKYWDEIESRKTLVLPVLLAQCNIPQLLKTRRYADFRSNYAVGLVNLMAGIAPTVQVPDAMPSINPAHCASKITALLAKVQDGNARLSECLSEGLALALELSRPELEQFCRSEIEGWRGREDAIPDDVVQSRSVQAFLSPFERLNFQYFGWDNCAENALSYMKSRPKAFFPYRMVIPEPVAEIESAAPTDPKKSMVTVECTWKDVFPDQGENGDHTLMVYAAGDSHAKVLAGIRQAFCRRMLSELPAITR